MTQAIAQEAAQLVELQLDGQRPISIQLGAAPYQIGRDRANSLVLPHDQVSRQHAELLIREGRPILRDRGSSNGTTVNGVHLARGGDAALGNGDVIGIGPYRLVFQSATAPSPPPGVTVTPGQAGPGLPAESVAIPESSGLTRSLRRAVSVAFGLFGLLAIIAISAGAIVWMLAPPSVSIVILGTDARPSELAAGDRGRTDTLLAYIADRDPGRNLMISVPRDLWVQTSTTTAGKINTVYRSGGADGARRAVSSTLGMPIDRYLVVGLQGVRDVVDALGGIDIDVESAIRDDQYPTDDFGVTVFEITAGPHHLDGETALRYARTRHGDDDLARIGRQQSVMTGIRNAMSNPFNAWRLPGALLAIQQSVQTDVGPRELATLASAYVMAPGAPERLTPSWNMVQPFTTPQGEAALRLQPAFRDALTALLIRPGTTVEVLNASGRSGTAQRAADTLIAHGIPVSRVDTGERAQLESVIQVGSRNRLAGQAVSSYLGLSASAVQVSGDLPAGVDVRVLLGAGYTTN